MIAPFDWRNQRAFGFDMFSEPIRRDAMIKAINTGKPQTSAFVTLIQEVDSDTQPGFLIYVPVFLAGAAGETLDQHQDNLRGFVYNPLRSRDLFRGIFGDPERRRSQVAIRVYDGERPESQKVLYSSQRFNENRIAHFQDQIKLEIPGRIWTLDIQSLPLLEDQLSSLIPNLMLIFGIPSSLIFFQILRINRQYLLKKQQKIGTILLVEDHRDDEELAILALQASGIQHQIVVARDGSEALEYIFAQGHFAARKYLQVPQLILLDLKLPKFSGLEVLQKLRSDIRTQMVPIVILTTSTEEPDLIASYRLGANSYIKKPVNFEEFSTAIRQVSSYWLQLNQVPPQPFH